MQLNRQRLFFLFPKNSCSTSKYEVTWHSKVTVAAGFRGPVTDIITEQAATFARAESYTPTRP